MAEFGFDLEDIKRLIKLVEQRGLERLRVQDEDRMIEIIGQRTTASPAVEVAFPAAEAPAGEPEVQAGEPDERVVISSPVVGMFYRSPSPDAPAYVEVGDRIEAGQPVGLIEAMKVFSEVTSDYSGIVTEIAAANGDLVKQGDPLLYLDPA